MSNNIGSTLVPVGNLTMGYAEMMLKDVTPPMFARLPIGKDGKPVQTNHPAWVFGHLGLYNARALELMGKPAGVAAAKPGWDAMFKNGSPCVDDPDGKIYPPMEQITSHFFAGFKAVLAALAESPDSLLVGANPAEGRMKQMFPTIGGMVGFMTSAHPMSHFGQISAWRRFQGLGSAM